MALRALADKKVLRNSSLNERNKQGLVQWKWNDGKYLVKGLMANCNTKPKKN
jgi:hypothetical protein